MMVMHVPLNIDKGKKYQHHNLKAYQQKCAYSLLMAQHPPKIPCVILVIFVLLSGHKILSGCLHKFRTRCRLALFTFYLESRCMQYSIR